MQPLCMPALSPTMEQGNIVSWQVKEGDEVAAGTVLAEIETDKATLAFENQDDGYVSRCGITLMYERCCIAAVRLLCTL